MIKYGNLERAESFFEEFLRKEQICFLKENEFSSRTFNSNFDKLYSLYTIFLGNDNIAKLNVVLSSQESFGKAGTFNGYILVSLGLIESGLSKDEKTNSLFCAFSEKENKLIFKPIVYMMKYMKNMDFHDARYADQIRIDRASKEELEVIKTSKLSAELKINPCKEAAPYKPNKPRVDGFYNFVINGYREILHKKLFIIMQNEMKVFLNKYNNYPAMWKLKFKVAKNILGE